LKNDVHDKGENLMKRVVAVSLGMLLVLQAVPPFSHAARKPKPDIELKAKFNGGMSSEYFGFVGFDIDNNTADWQHIVAVDIVFENPVHEEITKIVSGRQLQAWNEAMAHKQAVKDFWWGMALGGLAAAGGVAAAASKNGNVQNAGVAVGAGSAASLGVREIGKMRNSLNFAAILPETHLLSGDFFIPPQMSSQKWVLFYTKHDENTPPLTSAKIVLTAEDQKKHEFDVTLLPYSLQSPTTQPWQAMIWRKEQSQVKKKSR